MRPLLPSLCLGLLPLMPLQAQALTIGDPAPPLKVFRWLKGAPVKGFQPGHVYVVELWATWCPPCRATIPHLTSLAHRYRSVTFSGISVAEKAAPGSASYVTGVRKFVRSEGAKMDYHVGVDSPGAFVLDHWLTAAHEDGIPTAFVVDKKGMIAWIGSPDDLEPSLKKILAGTYDLHAAAEARAKLLASREEAAAPSPKSTPKSHAPVLPEDDSPSDAVLAPIAEDFKAGKFKEAEEALDKLIESHPKWWAELQSVEFAAIARQDPERANAYAEELMTGKAKDNAEVLNSIAWAMVDEEVPIEGTDTALAERMAAKALLLLDPKTQLYAETLDTLALAQYRNGKQGDAEANEERAVELYSKSANASPETLKGMRTRLTKYRNIKV